MATQITWTISQLERTLPTGVVFIAHWRVSASDGAASGTVYGTAALEAKDPSDPTFVPYEDLTEALVIDWVKDVMGEEQVAAHEANVQAQIDAQQNPVTAAGTPWAA